MAGPLPGTPQGCPGTAVTMNLTAYPWALFEQVRVCLEHRTSVSVLLQSVPEGAGNCWPE